MAIPINILLLEDNPSDAELILHELRNGGYSPKWKRVETEQEFVANLDPSLDVILADFRLPEFDGIRALHLLREHGFVVPLILVSGTMGEELAVLAMQHGAADYLLKDRLARLGLSVKRALERKKEHEQTRLAEEAVRFSERLFRALIENSSDATVLVSPSGRLQYAAPSMVRVLGYQEQELLGQNVFELVHPEDRDFVSGQLSSLSRQPAGREVVQARIRHKNGTWRWIEAIGTNQLDDPSIRAIVVNYRDVTERRYAEQALRASEERLKLALAGSHMGVWEWDIRTNAVWWSQEVASIVGTESLEETLEGLTSLLHPEDAPRVMAAVNQALATKTDLLVEFRIICPDGKVRWLVNSGKASYDDTGKAFRMIGTVQDITERMAAEQDRLKLFRAVEQSSNLVVITDVEGRIEYVNPRFTEVTGYTPAEVIGRNPRILKSGETPPEQYRDLWESILSGREWHGEFHNKRKNGDLYWEHATISPIKNAKGILTHFLAIKEDLTSRRILEEQVRQSQKMEAVGRLAGGVAHDLNNLLGVIVGYASMEEGELPQDDPLLGSVQAIREAGERATTMIRQLLAFSRKQVFQLTVLNPNDVIKDLNKLLRRMIGEDVDLITVLGSEVGTIKADVGQIEQVIVNLAVNSRDAMPDGGRLTIETANVELDETYARDHVGVRPGPYVMFKMSDTGTGIDPKIVPHIFEPFFTTKEKGKGTGLGLSTVYGIVKQSGGEISVHSEQGKGTTIEIYLPRVEEPKPEPKMTQRPAERKQGVETVLVVEDDEMMRKVVVRALTRSGYRVIEADSPEVALAALETHDGTIHLLLTDVVMPGMSGVELGCRLTSLVPGAKVLYMSGYSDSGVVIHDRPNSGLGFIQKPFNSRVLLEKVREILGSE